jgi:hypothetical protein
LVAPDSCKVFSHPRLRCAKLITLDSHRTVAIAPLEVTSPLCHPLPGERPRPYPRHLLRERRKPTRLSRSMETMGEAIEASNTLEGIRINSVITTKGSAAVTAIGWEADRKGVLKRATIHPNRLVLDQRCRRVDQLRLPRGVIDPPGRPSLLIRTITIFLEVLVVEGHHRHIRCFHHLSTRYDYRLVLLLPRSSRKKQTEVFEWPKTR